MYFWNIDKLKEEMAAGPFTDRQLLPYVVTLTALSSAAVTLLVLVGSLTGMNLWDWLSGASSFLLAIVGTLFIYRRNGGPEGKHFLQRILVVGWVVSIRCLVAMVAIMFLLAVLVWSDETVDTKWYDALLFAVVEAVAYWRIGYHVRDLATRTADGLA
ncbi:MAG: hypothetical protein ACR2HJ_09225 [Fimbriimonadales bacterium]